MCYKSPCSWTQQSCKDDERLLEEFSAPIAELMESFQDIKPAPTGTLSVDATHGVVPNKCPSSYKRPPRFDALVVWWVPWHIQIPYPQFVSHDFQVPMGVCLGQYGILKVGLGVMD